MNKRELILDIIEENRHFLIPSRREVFSIMWNINELTKIAKELFKEGLIDWSVSFGNGSSCIVLGKPKSLDYSLTDKEKQRILNKLNKSGYYILKSKKVSKVKNWKDTLNFLKTLIKEDKLDWHINFNEKKYEFASKIKENEIK